MWIKADLSNEVDRLARVFYIGREQCLTWNSHRRGDEPRLLTGWCWSARNGEAEQHGLKTRTMAYIQCHYALVLRQAPPKIGRSRLRLVKAA